MVHLLAGKRLGIHRRLACPEQPDGYGDRGRGDHLLLAVRGSASRHPLRVPGVMGAGVTRWVLDLDNSGAHPRSVSVSLGNRAEG